MINACLFSLSAFPQIQQEKADSHSRHPVTRQPDYFRGANTPEHLEPGLGARTYSWSEFGSTGWQSMGDDLVSYYSTYLPDSPDANSEWLKDALQELKECPDCAYDEDMAEPSALAMIKAKQLLTDISAYVKSRPDVYPMDESGIAVDFRSPDGQSGVLFLIEEDGSGALFHRTSSLRGRLRVDNATALLREGGIRALKSTGIR